MFAYLKYFSIVAFLVVIVASVFLGMYIRNIATEDLAQVVGKNNRALVQGFVNQLWQKHPASTMVKQFQEHDIPVKNWSRYRGYKETFGDFSKQAFSYFEDIPIVQLTIYSAEGEPILSINRHRILPEPTDSADVIANISRSGQVLRQAQAGNSASEIHPNSQFILPNGETVEGVVIQTAVPILTERYVEQLHDPEYSKANNVQAVVEVLYDITRQWDQLSKFQYAGSGGIMLLFFLLIATLFIIANKAEAIIAKQHEANLELAAQAAAAEAENRNKSQFLANISHELRTPLNAIIGFSEIIKNEVMGQIANPQYQDYIRDIHASGVHLLSLINDILDYSKAEAGKLEVSYSETDVTKIVQNSMRLVSPRAEQGQITLIADIPKQHYVLHTDAKKLKQIMLNLLSNAVKFTDAGGEVKVTMWQNVVDDSLAIEVKDNGIGISAKDISRALAPFGQVDSALSRRYEGTGLGLPLTKKFIELLGGTFSLQSEEGVGTAVTFTLPKKPKALLEQEAKAAAKKQED